MQSIIPFQTHAKTQISSIEVTHDCLADRGGLALLMRYTDQTGIVSEMCRTLEKYRRNHKGIGVPGLIRQVLAFLMDGSSRHLTYFDHLKKDPGYCGVLETPAEQMVSSHQLKRFFAKLPKTLSSSFRHILRQMVVQRICQEKPEVIELFLDTMVLNNDDATCRQGVSPTYKQIKGFQPLQLIWDGQIIDAQFRGGKKNGNHGLTAFHMIKKAVKAIRKGYCEDVPIIVRMDGGFFDGELFWRLDTTNVGFVCSGRISPAIKEYVEAQDFANQPSYDQGKQVWHYTEFATRCLAWDRFYRAVYMKAAIEDGQGVFEFAGKDSLIISNLGVGNRVFNQLPQAKREALSRVEKLIAAHHAKGRDELTHRRLKDFGFEAFPFKSFAANTALYYVMVIGFNVMEFFKRDVLGDQVTKRSYPTTVRRVFVDFAAKIVRSGRKVVMKVTASAMERLNLARLWARCREQEPLFG